MHKTPYLLGLDLGTSSLKCLLQAADGSCEFSATREYPTHTPQANHSEQRPTDWWQAAIAAVRDVLTRFDGPTNAIQAIGLSGQMHGTVLLNAEHEPLGNAIIWADQRSAVQCDQVYNKLSRDTIMQIGGSGLYPGFMLATLLWVQQHQPTLWQQARWVLFPKDYLRFKLTNQISTEVTDAAGGLLLDIRQRTWAAALTTELGIPPTLLPPLLEAQDIAGKLTPSAAQALGLSPGIPVVAGGADQATGALGSGLIEPGVMLATLGTGGQLVSLQTSPHIDPHHQLHTLCHAQPRQWYLLGATLAAGLAFRWLRDNILQTEGIDAYPQMIAQATDIPPGAEGLYFLPYLTGERVGEQRSMNHGAFVGLGVHHHRKHLIRAAMEGILFSMKQMFDRFTALNNSPQRIIAAGGGMNNPIWQQQMADIFGLPVTPLKVQAQSALGAVILAGLGIGLYADPTDATAQLVSYAQPVTPRPEISTIYQAHYAQFKQIYHRLS